MLIELLGTSLCCKLNIYVHSVIKKSKIVFFWITLLTFGANSYIQECNQAAVYQTVAFVNLRVVAGVCRP
jgi:hypothetical protein